MAKHTLKILRCQHRKIFKVCLAILQHYARKGDCKGTQSHNHFVRKRILNHLAKLVSCGINSLLFDSPYRSDLKAYQSKGLIMDV